MLRAKVNAIILAGGKNSRMAGEDKAFLEIEGKPIIALLITKLKALVNEIIVVTNNPEKYDDYKVQLVKDESLGLGPLMGIYSGLKASSAKYNFVIACDMPFFNKAFARYIIEHKDTYDAVVPKIDDVVHPLCALYSTDCIPVIEKMLRQNRREVRSIFPEINVRFLAKQEIEKFDKNLLSLLNINTKDDFAKARAIRLNSCL